MRRGLSSVVVRVASWLVPPRERREWRLEWESEIWHHRAELRSERRLDWRMEMRLIRRSFGAFVDALDFRGSASLREGTLADVRYGLRMLRKSPGFTVVAVFLLALGIGATTAIFSVVRAVLLEPLPFRDPERLAAVWEVAYKRGSDRNVVSPFNFLEWRERSRSFEALSAFAPWDCNLTGGGDAERVPIGYVSADFFSTLGVSAARGRIFSPEDGVPGHDRVVVLGDGLWKRRFGSDPAVIGKTLGVNGTEMTIVGVLPPGLELPSNSSGGGGIQLWNPIAFTEKHREFGGRYLTVVGRMAPGILVDQARDEMKRIASGLEKEKPDFDAGWSASVIPLKSDIVRDVREALLVLLAAVASVLLIACANVGNLLLTRAVARERELSVRAALGAHRFRIFRQLLVESLLLAGLGGVGGILAGAVLLRAIVAATASELPPFVSVHLDGRVLSFALVLSFATSLLFGLLPAILVSRRDLVEPLKEGARAGSSGARKQLKNALVVAETALAVVLLVATGLLLRSFVGLAGTDPGFDPRRVTAIQINLAGPRYQTNEAQSAYFTEALQRLGQIPSIERAAAISWLPLGGGGAATSFRVADKPDPPPEDPRVADVRVVAGDLFRTMGIPVVLGRGFDDRDRGDSASVVIINEALAKTVWPGETPIGKTVLMEWGRDIAAEVVGVSGDVRLDELDTAPRPTLYWPYAQFPNEFMTLVVREKPGSSVSVADLRARLAGLDPEIPVSNIVSMEEVVSRSLGRPRLTLSLMSLFGVVALLLASVGIYGVIAFSVSQRVREFGLRRALGASAWNIEGMVLRQGLALALAGIGIGIVGAVFASHLIEGLLYQVEARDPVTLLAITFLLLGVAVAAAYVPARRATRVDPFEALRID
jgi:putative ABC transport system permease protein